MPKKSQVELKGYLLPETIDPPQVSICICIPCDTNHALAFLGQLKALGDWWTWERDVDKRGKDAAQVWREIFDDVNQQLNDCGVFDMSCGCDEKTIEQQYIGEDGHLHVIYSDGSEEIRDDLDPRYSGAILPPMPGDDGEEKKCVAANSAVTAIQEVQENELAALEDNTNLAQTLFTILAGLVGVIIGLPVVGIPAFLVILMYAVVNFLSRQIPSEFEAAFTEETWQEVLCLLFCNMNDDGSFTEAQFETIRGSIDTSITGAVAIEFFQRHFDVFGVVGLTNMARSGYGGSRDCDDCACSEDCGFITDASVGGWDQWEVATERRYPDDFATGDLWLVNLNPNFFANGYGSAPNQVLAPNHTFESRCIVNVVDIFSAGESQPVRMSVSVRRGDVWTDIGNQVYASHSGGVAWHFEADSIEADEIQIQMFADSCTITGIYIS